MVLPPGVHDEVNIGAVENGKTMRKASMKFLVAKVQRPLASAAKVVVAGSRIVIEKGCSFIENVATGEKMKLRVERGTYFFDVKYNNGEEGTITLDSGAGVNVAGGDAEGHSVEASGAWLEDDGGERHGDPEYGLQGRRVRRE